MTVEVKESDIEAGAFIDRDVYRNEEIFRLEKERIFYKTWHFACLTHEVKNSSDYFAMSILDQPILIVRGSDGELRAFYNACTHRGATLQTDKRSGNCGRRFVCMYHAWTFSTEGALIGVPYKEGYGPSFKREDYNLKPVHCEIYNDLVFVSVNPDAVPLKEYLGEMAPVLDMYTQGIEVIARNSWIYNGNWKLWHENFRDNYHPQFAHRAINDAVPHFADRGGNWALEPGHSRLQWICEEPNFKNLTKVMKRMSGVAFPEGAKPMIAGGEYEYAEAPQEVLAIFPNMDMQPGSQSVDGTSGRRGSRMGHIQTVTPLGVDKTRVDYIAYTSNEDDPDTRKAMLEGLAENQGSWGKVSNDDVEAAIRCQDGLRGLGTRYSPVLRGVKPSKGGLTPDVCSRDEYSLREFYRVYYQYLEAEA
ncbi:aromatic ring-hydroxylating oxygenase subunit alpha [Novosphingobium album (ex Liu et al. 2023)]|uniref:Aromatic ring-hydroxylating dioxygenase subunit alpha n=1 Tax=Novosphingobium album (ex Liu et al. 2023) TaxID=3031130 RepID=A0ABT5WTJ3_9SPHN|nr:aromatic ring-hydroxylating dioxygenase subunit alpha [Novosphingobium album (ex Liu et al. 2023)]MDE8653201.1 aromatic ring-hydroxylating dioxygenase subunit alpha [Novosphingobium album (ex Liu et al. 2023)]